MPATNRLRPESTARTGCIYSRSCKAELVVKEDGTTLSMCEEHKNYQAVKLRERRAKMPSRQFDPLQCQYPGGCKKERLFKLNGDRQLCRSHLATYVQKEIDNLWHNVVLYLPRMDRSSADIMVTLNAEVSQGAEDGNGSERFPVEVFHCNILPRTLYMLVPVVIEGTQQLLTLAVHENQASGAAIQVQSVAVPVVTSAPGHIEGSAAPSSATSREPNRTVRSDMWRRLADTERLETLKRMDQDPRFMSICAELWEMYQTTTG
ncbi:hypothetical protein C6341_g2797 [Phytophthora cactorum]|nr:hypothetical protein C6341_g2797 [Phytophthora cactorum]